MSCCCAYHFGSPGIDVFFSINPVSSRRKVKSLAFDDNIDCDFRPPPLPFSVMARPFPGRLALLSAPWRTKSAIAKRVKRSADRSHQEGSLKSVRSTLILQKLVSELPIGLSLLPKPALTGQPKSYR